MNDMVKARIVLCGLSVGICVLYALVIASTYSGYLDLLCKVFAQ